MLMKKKKLFANLQMENWWTKKQEWMRKQPIWYLFFWSSFLLLLLVFFLFYLHAQIQSKYNQIYVLYVYRIDYVNICILVLNQNEYSVISLIIVTMICRPTHTHTHTNISQSLINQQQQQISVNQLCLIGLYKKNHILVIQDIIMMIIFDRMNE